MLGLKGVKWLLRALQVSCSHSEERDSLKPLLLEPEELCCLLPAPIAPAIVLPQGLHWGGRGGNAHKSYYLAYKRGKRVCPYCEEGN